MTDNFQTNKGMASLRALLTDGKVFFIILH